MGRSKRIHFPGAIYHVTARGVDGRNIYIDDQHRTEFLADLRRICADSFADILAYCLMGNHFHLAIRVRSVSLSTILHRLLTAHAQTFNKRLDRMGHLFQGRHRASICLTDAYLAAVIRYIHMNPVRAGLVLRPEDWPWSSLGAGLCPPDSQFELEGFDPWPKNTQEIDLLREDEPATLSLDEIGEIVSVQSGVDHEDLRSRSCRRTFIAAKRLLAHAAVQNGHKLGDIAKWMGASPSSISRYARAPNCKVAGQALAV
jgi:REP element-mobilizing transposase RayT